MVIVQVRILEQEETHIVYPMIKMVLVNCFQSVLKKKKSRWCSIEVFKDILHLLPVAIMHSGTSGTKK